MWCPKDKAIRSVRSMTDLCLSLLLSPSCEFLTWHGRAVTPCYSKVSSGVSPSARFPSAFALDEPGHGSHLNLWLHRIKNIFRDVLKNSQNQDGASRKPGRREKPKRKWRHWLSRRWRGRGVCGRAGVTPKKPAMLPSRSLPTQVSSILSFATRAHPDNQRTRSTYIQRTATIKSVLTNGRGTHPASALLAGQSGGDGGGI